MCYRYLCPLFKIKQMQITPQQITKLRLKANLTQEEAGKVVYVSRRTWQSWETPIDHPNHRKVTIGLIELFCIKFNIPFPPKV